MIDSAPRRLRTFLVALAASTFMFMAFSTQAQAQHEVWDFIWHTGAGNAVWGPGIWTKDSVPICVTFPGGIATNPPPDVHVSHHIECPDWPNDWHWTLDIPSWHIEVWFTWGSIPGIPTLNVPVLDPTGSGVPPYMLDVDVEGDTWVLQDSLLNILDANTWSGYPDNSIFPVLPDIERMTEEEMTSTPALSPYGIAGLVALLGASSWLMVRRRSKALN